MSRPELLLPLRLSRQIASRSCRVQKRVSIQHASSRSESTQAPWATSRPAIASQQWRLFSHSTPTLKKKGKDNLSHARSEPSAPGQGSAGTPTDEAFDLSGLQGRMMKAMERLTHDLSQLRAGGRFNPEILDNLRVDLKKLGGGMVKLGEIAELIPKGRVVSVVVGDEEYIKPVQSAIQQSPHNLVPQAPSPDAPTTVMVPIPPPTGESQTKALEAADKAGVVATKSIQEARAAHQKKLRTFEKDKSVRPDDMQKAHKLMEEAVKTNVNEVKRIVDGAKKVLNSQ